MSVQNNMAKRPTGSFLCVWPVGSGSAYQKERTRAEARERELQNFRVVL